MLPVLFVILTPVFTLLFLETVIELTLPVCIFLLYLLNCVYANRTYDPITVRNSIPRILLEQKPLPVFIFNEAVEHALPHATG